MNIARTARFHGLEIKKNDEFYYSIEEKILDKYLKKDGYSEMPKSEDSYDFSTVCTEILKLSFDRIYIATKGEIKNKRFLCLGCGSTDYNTNHINSRLASSYYKKDQSNRLFRSTFEPWIPRILLECGAQVIGVDYGGLRGEEFEHYSVNLLEKNVLNMVQDGSVDYVHVEMLWNSPLLEELVCQSHGTSRNSGYILRERLLPQIECVLKPTGIFLDFSRGGRLTSL
ncbi:hypothetical protein HN385_01080 [archaeon]|jgi:hypothetical protein|nr:hypothetical protein [archaeon]MBT3450598.1 hypothetical protein [archaeon]MBT6868716.1 hypothetical protein [archaeon]MBT7193504.1 hypothetical protein [archaeon]MBT7381095.1 hypothetical protein [archaeon]